MLASLSIQNIVLIDTLSIEFDRALTAFTGETGAGKSILLDSLGLALGARSESSLIRHGADKASVSAVFEVDQTHLVMEILKEHDIEAYDTLILKRVLTSEGRSKAYINDQPVSATLLKQIGSCLVEIHGQFDTHRLLDFRYHCRLLDEYALLDQELKLLKSTWDTWQYKKKSYEETKTAIQKTRTEEE